MHMSYNMSVDHQCTASSSHSTDFPHRLWLGHSKVLIYFLLKQNLYWLGFALYVMIMEGEIFLHLSNNFSFCAKMFCIWIYPSFPLILTRTPVMAEEKCTHGIHRGYGILWVVRFLVLEQSTKIFQQLLSMVITLLVSGGFS